MRMDPLLVFLFLLFFVSESSEKVVNVKLCVVANPRTKPGHVTKYCDLLDKSKKSPVTCVYAGDRLECLRLVSNRDADFTVMEPEDLYLSTLWEDSAILVVSEIRAIREMPFKYGTVLVVKNSLNITGLDLRGRKLCHPGLKSGSKWNDLFAQYLEERLAPRNCEPDITVFEDRIKTSANFFGDSCKAGPWTDDEKEDRRLKNEYQNMCTLCELGDCSNSEKYRGSAGSLICLTDGVGDVVWARYDDVKTYFKKFSSDDDISPLDYSFLCEDGTLKPLDVRDPCIWLAMPWQVIVANRKSANEVQKIFHDFGNGAWEQNFVEVIESYLHFIINLQVPKTPEDFLKNIPGYLSAMEMSQGNCKPKHSVKLCTSSPIEQEKCLWMSMAALSVAIQPPLECTEKANITACLESVANGTSDVVVVPPDHAADATTKHNLTTLYYEIPNQIYNFYMLVAATKENSGLKILTDLKQKTACFTRVNGVGWNTALTLLKYQTFTSSSCHGRKNLLEFFAGVCVVNKDGAQDVPVCCNRTEPGEGDELDGLKCLLSGGCDVAFLDASIISHNNGDSRKNDFKSKGIRTVCASESADCSWSESFPNYLMINSHLPEVKFQEISSLLLHLGDILGRKSKNDNKIMEIFGPYHGKNNVLFKDTSVTFSSNNQLPIENDYLDVMDEISLCSESSIPRAQQYLLLLLFLILILANQS